MRRRMLALLGGAAVIAVVSLVSVAGQAPTTSAQTGSAIKTSWGEPDLAGHLDHRVPDHPCNDPRSMPGESFSPTRRSQTWTRNGRRCLHSVTDAESRAPKAMSPAPTTRGLHDAQAYGPAHVDDCRSAGRARFLPSRRRCSRGTRNYASSCSPTWKPPRRARTNWRGCEGGKYTGVPSPRMREPYTYYPGMIHFNRADGPEDHGLGMRCLSAPTAGLRTWFRIRLCRHLAPCRFSMTPARDKGGTARSRWMEVRISPRRSGSGGATRAATGRATRWSSTSPISAARRTSGAPPTTCI